MIKTHDVVEYGSTSILPTGGAAFVVHLPSISIKWKSDGFQPTELLKLLKP
jgi:hypothetical protein